jgi:hypothetical protein
VTVAALCSVRSGVTATAPVRVETASVETGTFHRMRLELTFIISDLF